MGIPIGGPVQLRRSRNPGDLPTAGLARGEVNLDEWNGVLAYIDPTVAPNGSGQYGTFKRTSLPPMGSVVWLDSFAGANDIVKMQAAHDFLGPQGGYIELPARDVVLDTSKGQVKITNPVRIRGRGWSETIGAAATRIVLPDASQSPFVISGGGPIGFLAEEFSIFQSGHPAPASGWAPAAYPVVFNCANMTGPVRLYDLMCHVVTKLVDCVNVGRPEFDNIRGQFLRYCYMIDQCLDSPNIGYIKGYPYWSSSSYVYAYTQANSYIGMMYRCDSPFIGTLSNILGVGVVFLGDKGNGCTTGFKVACIYSDACVTGILVDASCDGTRPPPNGYVAALSHGGVAYSYTGGGSVPAVAGAGGIVDNGNGTRITFGYYESAYSDSAVQQNGKNGILYFLSMYLTYWSHVPNKGTSPAIYQNPTAGKGPNRIYIATKPIFANDVNGQTANLGGDGVLEGQAQGWTPTFSAQTGTLAGQPTINAAIYTRRDGFITCYVDFTITSGCIGSGANALFLTLPFTSGPLTHVALGEELNVSGTGVFGRMGGNSGAMALLDVNGNTIIKANWRVSAVFTYQAAVS